MHNHYTNTPWRGVNKWQDNITKQTVHLNLRSATYSNVKRSSICLSREEFADRHVYLQFEWCHSGKRIIMCHHTPNLTDWMIDWLVDWLIDWLIDWLMPNILFPRCVLHTIYRQSANQSIHRWIDSQRHADGDQALTHIRLNESRPIDASHLPRDYSQSNVILLNKTLPTDFIDFSCC